MSERRYRRSFERGTDAILSPYLAASWWQPEGRSRVIRRLEKRGFPSLDGWLFFTLTVRADDMSEEDALERGKDRLRRVFHELRRRGYSVDRYFSKLELHGSGYPHWHVGVQCRRFISSEEVSSIWGLGFVKVRRIKENTWRYLLKYVVKGNGAIPDWVLDYPKRIRIFQTSVGFYETPGPERKDRREPKGDPKPTPTLREKFTKWERSAVVWMPEREHGIRVDLPQEFRKIFCEVAVTPGRFVDGYQVGVTYEELLSYVFD